MDRRNWKGGGDCPIRFATCSQTVTLYRIKLKTLKLAATTIGYFNNAVKVNQSNVIVVVR